MNPRQIALVVWVAVALVFLMTRREIRESVINLVKTALTPKLLVLAVLGLLWNAAVIYNLFRLEFWNISMWWDTMVFVLFGTAGLVWRMTDLKDYSNRFFVKAVLTTFGITVLLGTLVSTYTFGLVAELLLIPCLVLLGGMLALAQSSDENRILAKPLTVLASIAGLAMLVRAVVGAVIDYKSFLSVQTLQSLLLLFVLTAAFIPYLFAVRVWMTYETALVPLKLGEHKSRRLFWYALAKMFLKFGFNLSRLQGFRTGSGNDLRWATTKKAVDQILERASAKTG